MIRLTIIFILFFFVSSSIAFSIRSSAFHNNEAIPSVYTCSGQNISPPIAWDNVPNNTKSFALIVSDPDAPSGVWFHWIVYNIPYDSRSLSQEIQKYPAKTLIGKNSFGDVKYSGPCPPVGPLHHYLFTVYALDQMLNLSSGIDGNTVLNAIENHVIDKVTLVGTYQKNR